MVLASAAPPPTTRGSSAAAAAASQTTVQCLVSDLALYPLPANLRLESIDFENLILQHVKNNLNARSDSSGAAAQTTPATATANVADLTRDMMNGDDDEDNLPKMVVGMENTGAEMSSPGEQLQKQTVNSSIGTRHFVVSLESDRLAWAALKSPLEGDGQSAVGGFDYTRHCCHYMSTCLSEIKLCYVNIQLPNIIIWLLSSIPQKIVKRETSPAKMSTDRQHNKSSKSKSALFALVLQCFREVDVVSMRQAYKQLRSMQKQTTQHQQLLTKKETAEMEVKKATPTEVEMKKSNRSSSKEQTPTKAGHHILSRQRVPAKLIQEDTTFHLKGGTPATSSRTATTTAAASGIQLSQKKNSSSHQMPQQMRCNHIRSYLNSSTASESEFDTTQISTYLSQKSTQHSLMKSAQQNSSNSKSARTRSRSVESPRHRLRLLYKPIDDIEILIPSAYGRATEQSGFRRTLTKSRPSIGTTLKGSKQKSCKDKSYYTDSLNSEGSSLSDESTSGDFAANGNSSSSLEFDQHYFSQLANKLSHGEQLSPKSACSHPIVIKSALKKSSSYLEGSAAQNAGMANYRLGGYAGLLFRSSPTTAAAAAEASSTRERTKSESRKQGAGGKNARHCANSNCAAKKNVTFSAYATIQVVDN